MRVIGYTFEADVHCVDCTLKRHKEHPFRLDDPLGLDPELGANVAAKNQQARGLVIRKSPKLDENGLPLAATDNEGNAVHPMFSTDESAGDCCGDCFEEIS